MIIHLTKLIGRTVAVNYDMVTYIEQYSDHCEVHFPNSYISVKESLEEIHELVKLQKIAKEIGK